MKINEMAERTELTLACRIIENRDVDSVYSCDLLSLVIGQAPAGSAWLTVMGNINAVAVASLADVGCIVLCHGVPLDKEACKKAEEQGVAVLKSAEPVFETALKIKAVLEA